MNNKNYKEIMKELFPNLAVDVSEYFGMRKYKNRFVPKEVYYKLIEIEKFGTELEKIIYELEKYDKPIGD